MARRRGEHGSAAAGANSRKNPVAVAALVLVVMLIALAVLAPWITPQNPYDLSQLSIMDNKLPPGSRGIAGELYLLGTDDQGRDMLSAIMFGPAAQPVRRHRLDCCRPPPRLPRGRESRPMSGGKVDAS